MRDIPKTVQETEQLYSDMLSEDNFIVIVSVNKHNIGDKFVLTTLRDQKRLPESEQQFVIIGSADLETYIRVNKKHYPEGDWESFRDDINPNNYYFYKVTTD